MVLSIDALAQVWLCVCVCAIYIYIVNLREGLICMVSMVRVVSMVRRAGFNMYQQSMCFKSMAKSNNDQLGLKAREIGLFRK